MSNQDPGAHAEIIIIKRGAEEEEGHHGGAWKIAFADFMTAMMALFLVLWLINAANEETKRAVASYFNPVKLVDRNRSIKGLDEQKGGPTMQKEEGAAFDKTSIQTGETAIKSVDDKTRPVALSKTSVDETSFFFAPNQALELIKSAEPTSKAQDKESQTGFADPFAPDFWTPPAPATPSSAEMKTEPETETPSGKLQKDESKSESDKNPSGNTQNEPHSRTSNTVDEINLEVKEALRKNTDNADEIDNSISVEMTEKGVLISVTDTLNRPMFAIGSAVPESPMVIALDAIAKALSNRGGNLHIFGHTDARPYQKSGASNWKLSTDRANAAYFMLLHGGLADSRVVEITGFADRKLLNAQDPFAGENRRIEILLGQL